MVNKKLFVIAIVTVILVGGGAAYYFLSKDSGSESSATNQNLNANSDKQTENSENQKTSADKVEGSLDTVSVSGKAQECDMTYSGPEGNGTAKMYSDGKGRGLMVTKVVKTDEGNSGTFNTLMTEKSVYSWSTDAEQEFGIMYDKDSLKTSSSSSDSTENTKPNPDQKFSMDCKSWTVDETKLTPPKGINFMSFPASIPDFSAPN